MIAQHLLALLDNASFEEGGKHLGIGDVGRRKLEQVSGGNDQVSRFSN